MNTRPLEHARRLWLALTLWLVALTACGAGTAVDDEAASLQEFALTEAEQRDGAQEARIASAGKKLFNSILNGVGNGRTCGTCHVADVALSLSPANVAARPLTDPLFNAIDADDPSATPLTFNNLRAGLIRVTLQLPENVDLVAIPPPASLFTAPEVSAQILALWQASVVPGAHVGDPLPPDRDLGNGVVIHYQPEIITPVDRKVSVWRAVPSVANTAYTAPYQFDGRALTLQEQAFSALVAHGQLDDVAFPRASLVRELDSLAAFQRSVFSDDVRTPFVARQISALDAYVDEDSEPVREDPRTRGLSCRAKAPKKAAPVIRKPCCDPDKPSMYCLSKIPDPEQVFRRAVVQRMPPAQKRSWDAGKLVYDQACAGCHGSATDNRITQRAIHDFLFFELDAAGNIRFEAAPDANGNIVQQAVPVPHAGEQLNIGSTFISQIGQIVGPDRLPLFNNRNGVTLPHYRLRFYEKATTGVAPRSVKIVDLPPLPVVSGGAPFSPARDPNKPGAIIAGPNAAPQLFSTDPGRALITGDWSDFEAFDVPQLRGIARTAPYFHDNSQPDLATLITTYSQLILPFFPQLAPFFPPVAVGTDRLTPQQKADLLTFLEVF